MSILKKCLKKFALFFLFLKNLVLLLIERPDVDEHYVTLFHWGLLHTKVLLIYQAAPLRSNFHGRYQGAIWRLALFSQSRPKLCIQAAQKSWHRRFIWSLQSKSRPLMYKTSSPKPFSLFFRKVKTASGGLLCCHGIWQEKRRIVKDRGEKTRAALSGNSSERDRGTVGMADQVSVQGSLCLCCERHHCVPPANLCAILKKTKGLFRNYSHIAWQNSRFCKQTV